VSSVEPVHERRTLVEPSASASKPVGVVGASWSAGAMNVVLTSTSS
jgi:hypothetical protein